MPAQHKLLKKALLAQALKNIAAVGLEGFSLRELAKQLHVSHASPYRHFDSKEALIKALLIEGYGILTGLLEAALASEQDSQQKLYALGFAYMQFFSQNRAYFSLMYEYTILDEEMAAELSSYRDKPYELLKTIIKENMDTAFLKRSNVDTVVNASWAYLHGLVLLWQRLRGIDSAELSKGEVQVYLQCFVDGIGA